MLHFLDLVLSALARGRMRNMDNCLLSRIKDIENVINIGTAVEEVADVELLAILVTTELLVVRVGSRIELRHVLRREHSLSGPTEVGTGHSNDMCLNPRDELPQMLAKLVVGVGR